MTHATMHNHTEHNQCYTSNMSGTLHRVITALEKKIQAYMPATCRGCHAFPLQIVETGAQGCVQG